MVCICFNVLFIFQDILQTSWNSEFYDCMLLILFLYLLAAEVKVKLKCFDYNNESSFATKVTTIKL